MIPPTLRTHVRPPLTTTAVVTALLLGACAPQGGDEPVTTPSATSRPSPDDDQPSPDDQSSPAGEPSPDEPDSDPTPGRTPEDEDVAAMAFTACEAERYTVGHPEEWNTNADDGLLGPCEIFHPGNIDEPGRPRDIDLHYAALLYVDEVDFDARVASDSPNDVLEERATTVDGHRARVVEYRSTGEALIPEGEHSYTWEVDLDGELLVATTSSVGETDYERDKRILDRMVTEELMIHDGAAMVDGPSTTEQSDQDPDGGALVVTDVRVGAHDGFDRVVFEVAGDGEAGWLIEYDDDPRSQGRGDQVEVAGDAALRVALRHVAYPSDAPAEPYDGPERIQPERTDAIVEVLQDVLYEGYQDFFIGLDEQRPYRVERLEDRVVVDIETG